MPKRLPIEDIIDRIYLLMKQKDDVMLDETLHQLCKELNCISQKYDDAYTVYVQFLAMACIVRAYIYADNQDAIQYEMEMIRVFNNIRDTGVLNENQFLKVLELINLIVRECNEFMQLQGYDIDCPDIIKNYGQTKHEYEDIEHNAEQEHDCYLCRSRKGVFKGSHLAPNFLIQPFLSYDHSTQRDKEIVSEIILGEQKKDRKWGRRVNQNVIKEHFGEVPEDELTKIKSNALTRDDYFCHECEDRFGHFETIYSKYFRERKQTVKPVQSYLFWLGVFWRLSIANMCIKMTKEDEEQARIILDNCMPYSIQDASRLNKVDNLGDFCYTIVHCSNIKGERTALIGNHTFKVPYKLLVGEYIVTLYNNSKGVHTTYKINDGSMPEEIAEVEFIEYWRLRQDILNETQEHEYANMFTDKTHLTDITFGGENDNLEKFFNPFGGKQPKLSKDDTGKYGMVIPGAIVKLLAYRSEYPFDTPEEFWEQFERESGYTKEDIEAINMFDKPRIKRLISDADRKRHSERQKRAKERQKVNKKRHKR